MENNGIEVFFRHIALKLKKTAVVQGSQKYHCGWKHRSR